VPYRELLKEILEAQETSEPLEAPRLRRYMAEKKPQTRALLCSLFTNASLWKLAKNIPSEEKTDFVLAELRMTLIESHVQQSKPALQQGNALMEITVWLRRLFDEMTRSKDAKSSSKSREIASALIRVLEDAARSGDEPFRSLIVTAVLEHVLSNEVSVNMFRSWRQTLFLNRYWKKGCC
jgi:hypothetical protein